MKFRTLSNHEVRLDIVPSKYPVRSRGTSKSDGQFNLGRCLQTIYGVSALLLEEFSIPGERLFLDFFMPHHKLAFEFHGSQHDKFNKFFHSDKKGFEKSRSRDERKKAWCELNGIRLIEVRDNNITSAELKDLIANG
jgi:hypothetical protein